MPAERLQGLRQDLGSLLNGPRQSGDQRDDYCEFVGARSGYSATPSATGRTAFR